MPIKKVFTHPFVLSLLIIISLVLFNNQGWLNPDKNIFYSFVVPGEEFSYQIFFKIDKFLSFITSANLLEQENINLKEENQIILGKLARLNEEAKENDFLREQANLNNPELQNLVLANIIGQDSSNLRKYFLINKGFKHGIKEGNVVIVAGNLLVGRVTEVFESFSKIQSIIDSNSRVNALIQGLDINGLIKGGQGNDLIIDLLPQGEFIEQGQLVVTSGLAGFFPNGLLIGKIEKVISSDVQISQMAKIKSAVDFDKLEKVFVIIE